MDTQGRPAWAEKYLRFAAWTQSEFRSLLCGIPPTQPEDAPARTREQINADYTRDELLRVDADRHIQDAVLTGQLKVIEPPGEQLLEKLRPHLSSDELAALTRAVVHLRACTKAYRVARDVAIRWAAARRELFPDFPYRIEDLKVASNVGIDPSATEDLRRHRRLLVDRALSAKGIKSRNAFCRQNEELTEDILRAVINGDDRRAKLELWTPKVLGLLGLSAEKWNNT